MHVNSVDASSINEDLAATPTSSKIVKKRKILRPTLGADAPATNLKEIDDAEEISSRNLYRITEQATKFNSPHVSPDRRKSIVTNAGMSNAQIVEHITNCLKLSAENKITSKNAFNLHLIDVMGSVLNNKTSETNFQAAGSTLDASAKIYAYRVDCVHQETYKIAGGLGRSDKNNKKNGKDEGDVGAADDEMRIVRDQLSPAPTKKRKKKVIKGSCIETNEKALNMAGNEVKFESDELFEKVRSSFDEGSAMGLFSNTLHTISDNNRLILHSLCDFPLVQQISSDPVDISELLNSVTIDDTETNSCCPPLKDFQFSNWNRDDDDSNENFGGGDRNEFAARLDFQANNTTNQTLNGPNDEPTIHYDGGLEAELNEDDDDMSNGETPAEVATRFPSLEAVANALSTKELEYSYFDPNAISTWAGPNHWKAAKFIKNEPSESADSQENNAVTNGKKKRQPVKRKQEEERINLDDDDLQFEKMFKVGKESTTLSKSTWERYYEQKRTLDPDMEYKPDAFSRLFLKPDFRIIKSKCSPDQTRDDLGTYDLDNPADKQEFCPDTHLDDEDDDDAGLSFGDGLDDLLRSDTPEPGTSNGDAFAFPTDASLDNDALLQQPYKVNKIEMNYAKRAKRIDVRRVKECIWRVLTEKEKKNDRSVSELPTHLTTETNFSKLCKELPAIVPPQAADNLSVHSILTILLHMCNEKNLALENAEDFGDLKIFQG